MRLDPLIFCEWSHSGKVRAWPQESATAPRLYLQAYAKAEVMRKSMQFPENSRYGSRGALEGTGLSNFTPQSGYWQGSVAELIAQKTKISAGVQGLDAAMSYRFQFIPDVGHTEVRLVESLTQGIPFERWALEAPDALLRGVDLAQRLVASESAVAVDNTLMINSSAIAGLTSSEAASLQLAPIAEVVAKLQAHGLFTQPSYLVDLFWARPTGQPIVGAQRVGAWLRIGDQVRRLPSALFTVAELVDALNASAGQGMETRLKSLAHLREALPVAQPQASRKPTG